MTIKIIKYYIILLVIFFSSISFVNASIEITEINNPEVKANHCWIKVYNNDSSEVTLTEWFVMDDDGIIPPQPWHYHKINAANPSELTLAPNSYAIIADSSASTIAVFKSKNPDISDPLFYGSLTFKDEGTMGLSKDKKTIIGQMSYSGTNISSSNNDENSTDNTDNTNTNENLSSSSSKIDIPEIFKITTKIISPKIVVAGIPFSLSSLTTTNRGKTYAVGKFLWNFGDGMMKEVGKSEPFDYVYEYPGEYVLALSYFDSSFSKIADATNRITIKVIPSDIYISSVGSGVDPFIELENKSNYEISLSNWVVTAGIHYFNIPEGTTLLPNKKIKFSPKITGFVGEDIKSIIITNPSKEIVATYPTETKKPIQKSSSISKNTSVNSIPLDSNLQNDSLLNNPQVINLNDLGASSGKSEINIPNSSYPLIGLLVVIGLGITSFLLIKMRSKNNDYVEKEIRAEDMTIIE